MKSIINRLLPILSRRDVHTREVAISLPTALAKLLKHNQLESLIARTPDRRLLLRAAASELKRPEVEILAQVAAILQINYTSELPAEFTPHLPSGVSVDDLERLGLVPLQVANNNGRAILCCDPIQIRFSALAGIPTQKILAPWHLIESALQQLRQQLESSEASARLAQEYDVAAKVLDAIVDQCKMHFVEKCQIILNGATPKYVFKTIDGRSGSGTIDLRIVRGLSALLSDSRHLTAQIESKRTAPGEFSIRWQNLRIDNVIPLVRPTAATISVAVENAALDECQPSEELVTLERQVMIVEDNPTFTRVLQRFLERIEVKTTAFDSVEAALQALAARTCAPRVIVADLHLPAKGGDDLIAAVRAMPHLSHVGIIVLTSDESCDAELKTIQLGADAFIGKNQDPRILCAHVERILSKVGAKRAA